MMGENLGEEPVASSGRPSLGVEGARPRRLSLIYLAVKNEPATTANWQGVAWSGVFLISIALPLAGMILRLDSAFLLVENRVLASRPAMKLDRTNLAEFPGKFEVYFNDQFGFRKRLIHWLNTIKVAGLGVSPSPKVILGQDGWLFYGGIYLDYYRAVAPFTRKNLEVWQVLLESRRDWLAARGIPYLLVIVPAKSTIYPEYMPRVYNRLSTQSRLDQLKAHLKTHSTLTILDLREPLLAAKLQGLVYYRTDTHWNNRGAYAGYVKITEALSTWFPELQAIPRSEFREQTFSEPGRDLALMLAMSDYYWDSYSDLRLIKPNLAHEVRRAADQATSQRQHRIGHPDIVYEHPDQKRPRAVMFHDSFATPLVPLLSEHFQRIVFSRQDSMERELVERERPNVVIQEIVERALMDQHLPSQ